ncbi:mesoderm induction early response protein 2-like [Uloborus diversus]|uniref:mesoderm induction early response protein 2-like n=1 Tax=Uloborus diversus TaxID=327109 RepID=UPI0024094863|nr:mesoderm induction early response protein 2-like [Uloborus diversus]
MEDSVTETKKYLLSSKRYANCKTRIGPEFQAVIPQMKRVFEDEIPNPMGDRLLWNPYRIPEKEVDNFINAVRPFGHEGVDEEKALYLLHNCDYNREEAMRRQKLLPHTPRQTLWSEEESARFEDGLNKYGKEFSLVQKMVRTRSVEDLVEFYYHWKKTERYDKFVSPDMSVFGKSKFRKKGNRRRAYKVIEHAEAIMNRLEKKGLN